MGKSGGWGSGTGYGQGDAVSDKNPHYLQVQTMQEGKDTGVRNVGFGSGMYLIMTDK